MGIAAVQRGDELIRRQAEAHYGLEGRRQRRDADQAIRNEEEALAWARFALGAAAEARERGGFIGAALSRSHGRTGAALLQAAVLAQHDWQTARGVLRRSGAAVLYAAAVFRLLEWQTTPAKFGPLADAPSSVRRQVGKR